MTGPGDPGRGRAGPEEGSAGGSSTRAISALELQTNREKEIEIYIYSYGQPP